LLQLIIESITAKGKMNFRVVLKFNCAMKLLKWRGFFFLKKRIAKERIVKNKGIEIRSSRLSENPKNLPPVSLGINNNQIMHINPSMLIIERRN
jgi:hypothetical protein